MAKGNHGQDPDLLIAVVVVEEIKHDIVGMETDIAVEARVGIEAVKGIGMKIGAEVVSDTEMTGAGAKRSVGVRVWAEVTPPPVLHIDQALPHLPPPPLHLHVAEHQPAKTKSKTPFIV